MEDASEKTQRLTYGPGQWNLDRSVTAQQRSESRMELDIGLARLACNHVHNKIHCSARYRFSHWLEVLLVIILFICNEPGSVKQCAPVDRCVFFDPLVEKKRKT